ncbi:xanthine dehydrogenase family protein molybdopterin-binding subunit [Lewinella sp. W8]|uniref:xanthine dehydrogenase family protein molybdopterin-binding subunit n=1 Tax=Lewinella sp. W8 TaxID=2528208 RepID=UPI001067DE2A|nr:molybdopterin cofactor-binding domain-containing protein [Lewinella sp. W8]MTB50029.1 molybdopterin-dependent oxidoreductase [Lewinella sp. W8]
MTKINTSYNRRSFLKSMAVTGGGMVLGFSWLSGCRPEETKVATGPALPDNWYDVNAYLKIGENGTVTIMTPNPEFGQNIKTSMPMIVAEELDVEWEQVISEQAPHNAEKFGFQFTGGSRGISSRWEGLRMAGATARQMLREAAAQTWSVPVAEVTTAAGMLYHEASERSAGYGEMAELAATLPVPEEVDLKDIKDFSIIGHSKKNVDAKKIVTGQPLFALDHYEEGMHVAMIVHPPAFGQRYVSIKNLDEVKSMTGIHDVFPIKTYKDGFAKGGFDTNAFPELVAIVGKTTWEVMQAKRAIEVEWEPFADYTETVMGFRGDTSTRKVPAGLESTAAHQTAMEEAAARPGEVVREDGDPKGAFARASRVIERTYSAPFLAHNCMEPINCFAKVENGKVWIAGPLQAPGLIEGTIAARMDLTPEDIDIEMTRMGGGFGRRAYSHYMLEAALIAQQAGVPVKLMYTREDDMTNGIYRPTYQATYRAALGENNELLAFHVKAGGIPESPLFANRFPAGAIDNYLAEEWSLDSNITIGAFRAPRSNFMAGAEQSFLDELAEAMGKDPIDFRLELLQRAENDPVGENNDYDAARYAGVLELVRDKAGWRQPAPGVHRGVSAYFCHNSYAAHVLDLTVENDRPVVQKVTCAIDCGIVVNPDAAVNMAEGGIVDGIGNAFFGELTFTDGVPDKRNFDQYRMIRMEEAPKAIDVHFVESDVNPTGLGEPPFPPIFGAVANALYKATGERKYRQPFLGSGNLPG